MEKEIWAPVLGYEGLYEVSNLGNVKSVYYNRKMKTDLIKPQVVGTGYMAVHLSKNKVKTYHRVHRLVWEAFKGPIPKGLQVNHINEDKKDNRLINLNLMTPKENLNWGTRNERSNKSKINGKLAKGVLQYSKNGEYISGYPSLREAGRQINKPAGAIVRCCQGKLKTAYGFVWRYAV